ncbi:sperm-associated antigen 6-like isoform X2 [Vespula maculifrons]|uniref:Sperm-associated antigen 6-like isoform X2 n=1 Tax=Vespula maculifrons TaxID=7453 RepID=A0ABD2BTK2_VESMC
MYNIQYIFIIYLSNVNLIHLYYSPGYPETLLEAVEQYQPKCPSILSLDQKTLDYSDSTFSIPMYDEQG